VKHLKQYRIPFSGLNAGKHNFEFDINKKFFDCYEHSIVKDGNLKAEVELQKQCDPEMLALFTSEPDSEEQKEEEIIDPRWEALRNIKNN